jgi:hypothetical protein
MNTTTSTWGTQASKAPQSHIYRIELTAKDFDLQFVTRFARYYQGGMIVLEESRSRNRSPYRGRMALWWCLSRAASSLRWT